MPILRFAPSKIWNLLNQFWINKALFPTLTTWLPFYKLNLALVFPFQGSNPKDTKFMVHTIYRIFFLLTSTLKFLSKHRMYYIERREVWTLTWRWVFTALARNITYIPNNRYPKALFGSEAPLINEFLAGHNHAMQKCNYRQNCGSINSIFK